VELLVESCDEYQRGLPIGDMEGFWCWSSKGVHDILLSGSMNIPNAVERKIWLRDTRRGTDEGRV